MKNETQNEHQIIRKDGRDCFVESLNDKFDIGRIHLGFYKYDMNQTQGQRMTDTVHIYIESSDFFELANSIKCGLFRRRVLEQKKTGDKTDLYQHLGGISAEKLAKIGKTRPDGKSQSRILQIKPGDKADVLLVASNGVGEQNANKLIIPKFGNNPENKVVISMSFEVLAQLIITTEAHYMAYLTAGYVIERQKQEKYQFD